MEEDEDDLYAENGAADTKQARTAQNIPEDVDVDDVEDEEDEDEDDDSSDSDIEILTERKPGEETSPPQVPRHSALRVDSRPIQETAAKQTSTQQKSPPPVKAESDPSGRPNVTVQSGRGYPEVRTSKIEVNGDPIFPSVGKPISDIEVDADLVEHEKPWRRPGADQSDYFNYGFDEFTWSTYCMRQKTMGEALNEQKAESASFEMMMGGMGMPGMPQMPGAPAGPAAQGGMPAMPTMPGMDGMAMPNQEQMAAALQQAMIAQGVSDPSLVDFNLFMQQQMQGGGQMGQAGVPQGPAAQQHGGYGGGQQGWQGQGQGGGGYGRGKRGQRW